MSKKKSKKGLWVGLGALVVLVGIAYVVGYFVAGNQVPVAATVAGVPIGTLSPAEAEAKLRTELASIYEQPITITGDGVKVELNPAEAGLAIDYAASVSAAGGRFSWNPIDIVRSFAGGGEVAPVFTVDEAKLLAAIEGMKDTFTTEPKDATVTLKDGKVETTDAVDGVALNAEDTAQAVRAAFEQGKKQAAAVLEAKAPAVTMNDVQSFVDGPLKQAMTGDVKLESDSGTITISQDQLGSLLTITSSGKNLAVGVDEKAFDEATAKQLAEINKNGPKDASYKFEGGKVIVEPSKNGVVVDEATVREAFIEAVTGTQRTLKLEGKEQDAEFTTAEAEALKPKEVIGEFSTSYPHAAYRNTNIGTITKKVNGFVLMPGETFSMNDLVGERTAENGFVDGYIISDGNLVKASGGGVSQAATTLFNAAFFAGFEDVEHKPHSLYFSRYPAGREATLYWGSVDLKFKNNTEYPAIIQGIVSPSSSGKQGKVTFKIWSIKTWDKVESSELVKSDYYSGSTRVSTASDCEPQEPIQGFTVNYKRLFYKDGKLVKEEPFRWRYDAGDRITCE